MVTAFLICMICSSVGEKKTSFIWVPVCICSQHWFCVLGSFSDILNTPVGWQAFQNICRYCLCILKDVLRECVEGMNGMTGICVSLTLHRLLPLRNYRKILRKNLHPKLNVKACIAYWSYLWHGKENHMHSLKGLSLLPVLLFFTYSDQASVSLWSIFFPC